MSFIKIPIEETCFSMSNARFGILFPLGEFCIFSKVAIVVFVLQNYT